MTRHSLLETGYFAGSDGAVHVTVHRPREQLSATWWIHVPAFGEEMNKSRALVARQARQLVAQGHTVLVPDLYGTGDSAGQLQDADWEHWLADILALADAAREAGARQLCLWGLRLGCLLATEAAAALAQPADLLLLWQPVYAGAQQMNQLLRLRLASGLSGNAKGDETAASLREQLTRGQSLEIAGYCLGGALYQAVCSRNMRDLLPAPATAVRLLEVVGEEGKPLTPVGRQLLEHWQTQGVDVSAQVVVGEPFWMTQELGDAPQLVEVSLAQAGACLPPMPPVQSPVAPLSLPASSGDMESLVMHCQGSPLVGLLHRGAQAQTAATAVLVVVGGPQYRVGSHRQFYHLASALALAGIPTLRFDYRGMGDSAGEFKGFLQVGEDITCAIDALRQQCPAVRNVVIWGLCDAATAAMHYAPGDERVRGLVLANPWVYSRAGEARAYLRHYYLQRLLSPEFWKKLFSGRFNPVASLLSGADKVREAVSGAEEQGSAQHQTGQQVEAAPEEANLVALFAAGLAGFGGRCLILLSERDLVAAQFRDASAQDSRLRREMGQSKVSTAELDGIDHTFSRAEWRALVEKLTVEFCRREFPDPPG